MRRRTARQRDARGWHLSRPARRNGKNATSPLEVPVWDPNVCIQCGKCVMVCPHAVIRSKVYEPALLETAPAGFKSNTARLPDWKGLKYTLQVSAEDCTGCAALRRCLPGPEQIRSEASRRSTCSRCAIARAGARQLGLLPLYSRHGPPHIYRTAACARCRSSSPCSSSPAPAPVAAKRRTSSCSPNCSATG